MSDIVTLARRHKHVAPTHYEGCEVDHIGCLVNRMADEIEGLRAEIKRMRTVYVLIASREAWPFDSATCRYEDKIIGFYISREAAEGAAKLLMAYWRIDEYALVGKP